MSIRQVNLESQEDDLQNIKDLEKNGENHLKNITRKYLIIKREISHIIHEETKANVNVGNMEN